MSNLAPDAFPVIGMSPGNSYFKDKEVKFLLEKTVGKFGKTAILVADIPAIATYEALGYTGSKARAKAVLKGNNLKNRTRKMQKELGFADAQVKIIDWATDVAENPEYKNIYNRVETLYRSNPAFTEAVDHTTRAVLEHSEKVITDISAATKKGVHYLLSELAFLEFAPVFLKTKSVVYVYHKNWPVYEDYVAGKFDNKPKAYLDFLLLETSSETYKPLKEEGDEAAARNGNVYEHILQAKEIRGAFSNYPPACMTDGKTFSGIFYELIKGFADSISVKLDLVEETGYGVLIDGLNEGRFDIFCSAVWPTPERLAQADFSIPLYHSDCYMWVREDDSRFAENAALDNPFFRIAIKENDISDSIANADFPNTRRVRVPQLSQPIELLGFVSEDKADATFAESYLVEQHNKTAKVKLIKAGPPIREYPNAFMFRKGEAKLKQALDSYLSEAISSGSFIKLFQKYVGDDKTFKLK